VESAWRPFELRAYRVAEGGRIAGQSVSQVERMLPDSRIFVERIRRGEHVLDPAADMRIEAGDVVALAARREVLTEIIGQAGAQEVDDRATLDVPTATHDVFVTSKAVIGKTLAQIAASDLSLRGVFLRAIVRMGQDIPIAPGTVIERGDVVRLTGSEHAVVRAANEIGETVLPSEATDFVALSLGIVAGAIIGAVVMIPLGALRIPLGTSVGTLLTGLAIGYVHSLRPTFARIPEGAIALMTALGLAAFVAMIGLGAGPHFIEALREAGLGLFFGGMIVTMVPLVVGLYFGYYALKLEPVLLLGGIAGAQTMTAGMAGVQEQSGSPVAVLGYSGTVAIGHILLTTWGTVIVHLIA
jgi:putative transport protein